MPYVSVRTNVKLTNKDKELLGEKVGKAIEFIPDKKFEKTMVEIKDDCCIFRGGKQSPCVFIDTLLRVLNPLESLVRYTKELFKIIQDVLYISPEGCYVNIVELNKWGSRGTLH